MKEIEYKFLVDHEVWNESEKPEPEEIIQAYIARTDKTTVRVRSKGSKAYITLKSKTIGRTRSEFEYEIPMVDAHEMMALFTERSLRKLRYTIAYKGRNWEVDVFKDKLEGLIIAELEVASEEESFDLPDWVTHDVSDDPQYFNSVLIEQC